MTGNRQMDSHIKIQAGSDERIAHAARNLLQWRVSAKSHHIKVKVNQGWVTLSGTVDWSYQKRAANHAVRQLKGIAGLSDEIRLTPKGADTTIKSEIEAALNQRAKSNAKNIGIEVHNGNVTLNGVVYSQYEREMANDTALSMPSVVKVIDQMVAGA